jgi:hypothetical protein
MRGNMLALAVVLACGAGALAAELVGVHGSHTQFTTTMETAVADKPVKMVLTGVALRQKYFLNIYALASYVQEGTQVHTPDELAAADCVKQLHLVMERNVEGKDMAEAFVTAIRMNHPEPAYVDEVNRLAEMLRSDTCHKGDHIYLTHLPGTGLRIGVTGKAEFVIANPQFSRAIWDIYLGPNNLGEAIKKGLVSRVQ